MADNNENQLPSIDADMLAAVTGGATGATDEQLTTMLQSLMSSIKDLAASRNSGNDQLMQLLPMMMIMMSHQQPHAVAAAPFSPPSGPISPGDGWVRVA